MFASSVILYIIKICNSALFVQIVYSYNYTSNNKLYMGILAWIVLGGIAGWIASLIMKTDASQGILLNVAVGIAGAFLGGLVFNLLGGAGITGFNLYSLFVAVLGSALFLWILKMIRV